MVFNIFIGMILGSTLAVFFIMAGLAFVDPSNNGPTSALYLFLKDIGGPVAAGFGGAIAGSLLSYAFQRSILTTAKNKDDSKDYNKAYTILAAKYACLVNIKRGSICEGQDGPFRFISMPSLEGVQVVHGNASELLCALVMEAGEDSLYGRASIAESLYASVIFAVEQRSKLYGQHRERSDASGYLHNSTSDISKLVEVHGVAPLVRLYIATEDFIGRLDESIEHFLVVLDYLDQHCAPKLKPRLGKVLVSTDGFKVQHEKLKKPFFKDADALTVYLNDSCKN